MTRSVAELSRVDFLKRQLEDIADDLAAARASGSHQAIAALHRRLADARDALDEALPKPATLEEMDSDTYRELFRSNVEQWPDELCEIVLEVYGSRYRNVGPRLVE